MSVHGEKKIILGKTNFIRHKKCFQCLKCCLSKIITDKSFHKNVNKFEAIFYFKKNMRLHNVQQDQILADFIKIGS